MARIKSTKASYYFGEIEIYSTPHLGKYVAAVGCVSGDKSYKISITVDGEFECACPAWKFGSAEKKAEGCKHIEIFKAHLYSDFDKIREIYALLSASGKDKFARSMSVGSGKTFTMPEFKISVADPAVSKEEERLDEAMRSLAEQVDAEAIKRAEKKAGTESFMDELRKNARWAF